MKRMSLMAVVLILAAGSCAWAMEPMFGIKGGVDLARESISPEHNMSVNDRAFGAAGVDMELPMWQASDATALSLRTDLLYVMRGAKLKVDQSTETDRIGVLELSPFLVYKYTASSVRPFIQAGPFASVNLSHKYTMNGTINGEDVSGSGTIPNWRKGNVGFNFGAGLTIPSTYGNLTLDGRYNLGLMNMNIGPNRSTVSRKTDGVLLMLGYNFNKLKW